MVVYDPNAKHALSERKFFNKGLKNNFFCNRFLVGNANDQRPIQDDGIVLHAGQEALFFVHVANPKRDEANENEQKDHGANDLCSNALYG